MVRLIFLTIIAFLVGAAAVAFLLQLDEPGAIPANGSRYRLSVEIMVDGRTIVASAVQQVELQSQGIFAGFGGTPSATIYHHGEAPFAQLPGLTLVTLMMNPSVDGYTRALWSTCNIEKLKDETVEQFIARVHSFRGSCEFPQQSLPVLASVRDPARVSTMTIVGDSSYANNSAPSDAHIVRAWLETTDEPITRAIRKALPFLDDPDLGDNLFDMRQYSHIGGEIRSTSFWRR